MEIMTWHSVRLLDRDRRFGRLCLTALFFLTLIK